MKFFALFCLFALCALTSAQEENEVKYVIDPFTIVTDTIIIIIPPEGIQDGSPVTSSAFASGNNIMGEERDLLLTVTSGNGNLLLSTGVSGGQFSAATPNEARGNSLYQLDGIDGSTDLTPNGLFGHPNNNFLAGDAFAIRVLMEADLDGFVTFRFFSGSRAAECSRRIELTGDDTLREYIIPYSSLSQGCDMSNIGAIEIFILMNDNIDVIIQDFSTWGPVQTCRCDCPAFTCRLYLDPDDENFSYYRTSQFGVFNPTTDLSTIYTSDTVVNPSSSPFPSLSTSFTTIFSTDFTTFFTSFSISTSFDTFSIIDDDDDESSNNSPDDSSSDAGLVSVSVALIAMIVVALF